MKYIAYVYICASFLCRIECETYELTTKPLALHLYNCDGDSVAHLEPIFGLQLRVKIYETENPEKRKALYVIEPKHAFLIKAPFAVRCFVGGTLHKAISDGRRKQDDT